MNERTSDKQSETNFDTKEIDPGIIINAVDDQTEELLSETIRPQNKRKKLFIMIGIVAGVFILTALTFFILAQMKTSEINKALDLGEKYLEEGKYEEAILAYDNAIAIDCKITAPYVGKAEVYVATHDYEKAESVLLEAKSIAPDPQTNILLIEVYDNTKKTGEADKLLDETASIVVASIAKTKDKTELVTLYDQLITLYQRIGKDTTIIKTLCQDAFAKTADPKYEEWIKRLTVGNTPSNISNHGYAAYYDGASYFSVDNCIYKKVGNDTSLIFKDTIRSYPSSLNVIDGWMYFYRSSNPEKDSGYYKVKIDGTNLTQIIFGFNNYDFIILNNRIYYMTLHRGSSSGAIKSINLDGSDDKTLIENTCVFTIDNDWIYYRPGEYRFSNGLYRMKLDGSQQECLFENIESYSTIQVNNDTIYKLEKNLLYKATLSDKNFSLLSNDKIDYINIHDGWIYYTSDESLTIKKMKCDGSEVTTLIAQSDAEIAATYGPLSENTIKETGGKYTMYSLINISGNNLYFLILGFKDGSICCVANLDGSNITKLGKR